jgi:hypothetical protein
MKISKVVFALLGVGIAGSACANLLTNGGFEDMPNWGMGVSGDSGYTALTGSQIPGWTIESGHAGTIHNTNMYPYISGGYSLNTDGEGTFSHNVDIYQDFVGANSVGYSLTFNWKNWYTDNNVFLSVSVTDTVTNTTLVSGSFGMAAGLHSEVLNFNGTGNALRLRVKHDPELGYNDNAFIVDNFSVQAVPEPASILTMLVGAACILRSRKR